MRENQRNYVKKHGCGYDDVENDDLFKHFFRIFLKELAFSGENPQNYEQFSGIFAKIKENKGNKRVSRRFYEETPDFFNKTQENLLKSSQTPKEITLPYEMKAFLIKKTRLDLHLFEKIFEIHAKSRKTPEKPKKIPNNSDFPAFSPKKFFREDVFIENFLEKTRKHGVSQLGLEEIDNFKEIIEKRRALLQKLEDSLLIVQTFSAGAGNFPKERQERRDFSEIRQKIFGASEKSEEKNDFLLQFYKENNEKTEKTDGKPKERSYLLHKYL